MNSFEKAWHGFDAWQQKRKSVGFIVAVIKKYSDDQAGYKAALLTYYGFLSLFPLLLLLTTLTSNFLGNHSNASNTIIHGITSYFPLLGNQLSSHVHSLHRSGLALVASLLFIIYGTRGVADAFRHGVQDIWGIPKSQQTNWAQSLLRSFGLVVIGGLGFLLAAVIAGIAWNAGHGLEFKVFSIVINFIILFWLFLFLINFSLPRHVTIHEIQVGAITAAIGLVLLQTLGGYLLARELKNLDALYSYFAVALGLLFWIYLQAQVLFYALEAGVVSNQRLHPKSLITNRDS
ncbi:MAG TPA: YihY/virulence factor BrkB family protein [Candidatus Saccharimonadales bacterium]|nr:YihY/virulence factor BrkB family protein [Candidatus Saccharimonadales bacterium]